RAVSPIRTEIVEPLRMLRRRLRNNPDADVARLREDVKALELAAEKLVQSRLAQLAGSGDAASVRDSRLAAAHANFALCLGPERTHLAEARVIWDAFEAFSREH